MLPSAPGLIPISTGFTARLLAPLVIAATLAFQTGVYAAPPSDNASKHPPSVRRRSATAAVPRILKVTPDTMQIGVPSSFSGHPDPDTVALVITGTGFQQGAVVRWNQHALPTRFLSSTRLEAKLPYGCLSIDSLPQVRPNTPGGSGPRGINADGATGTAWLRVRNRSGRTSRGAEFTVSYVVLGG